MQGLRECRAKRGKEIRALQALPTRFASLQHPHPCSHVFQLPCHLQGYSASTTNQDAGVVWIQSCMCCRCRMSAHPQRVSTNQLVHFIDFCQVGVICLDTMPDGLSLACNACIFAHYLIMQRMRPRVKIYEGRTFRSMNLCHEHHPMERGWIGYSLT